MVFPELCIQMSSLVEYMENRFLLVLVEIGHCVATPGMLGFQMTQLAWIPDLPGCGCSSPGLSPAFCPQDNPSSLHLSLGSLEFILNMVRGGL